MTKTYLWYKTQESETENRELPVISVPSFKSLLGIDWTQSFQSKTLNLLVLTKQDETKTTPERKVSMTSIL